MRNSESPADALLALETERLIMMEDDSNHKIYNLILKNTSFLAYLIQNSLMIALITSFFNRS
jgi:hypothetical protein